MGAYLCALQPGQTALMRFGRQASTRAENILDLASLEDNLFSAALGVQP